MLYVDVKFANLLNPFLRNYKKKNDALWNFSCPVCGDSTKNKLKARGYIFRVKTNLFVKCHNCGYSDSIGNFIKQVNPSLYNEYIYETYKNKDTRNRQHDDVPDIFKQPSIKRDDVLLNLKSIKQLHEEHPVVQYCIKRHIPKKFYDILFYAPKFISYYNSIVTEKKSSSAEHPRLIIPFFDVNRKCFAFQARAFGKEIPKYYTVKLDQTKEKIYGLERFNMSKRAYIVEGPIDSLFIDNCIAVSGSSFNGPIIDQLKSNATIIYDNEPRSPVIIKLLEKSIERGFDVCIWPDNVMFKDINDMVINGMDINEIRSIIDSHTFNGLTAKVHLQHWRKC